MIRQRRQTGMATAVNSVTSMPSYVCWRNKRTPMQHYSCPPIYQRLHQNRRSTILCRFRCCCKTKNSTNCSTICCTRNVVATMRISTAPRYAINRPHPANGTQSKKWNSIRGVANGVVSVLVILARTVLACPPMLNSTKTWNNRKSLFEHRFDRGVANGWV